MTTADVRASLRADKARALALTPVSREAEARLDRDIDRFRLLTRDNPKNQKRAEELRKMFADRFKVLNAGIILSPYVPSLPPELVSA